MIDAHVQLKVDALNHWHNASFALDVYVNRRIIKAAFTLKVINVYLNCVYVCELWYRLMMARNCCFLQ